jgi:hypothetical protein
MKLIFTNYPFTKQEGFVFGFENQVTVDEFLSLFGIASIDKNIHCKFPNESELKLLTSKIKAQELKNVLVKYPEKEILIMPLNEDHSLPKEIHHIKV